MKRIFTLAVALGIAALSHPAASQAQATGAQKEVLWDWWLVYAGGKSPAREVIYIDSLSVENVVDHAAIMNTPLNKNLKEFPIDFVQADGVLITEDTNKPASVSGRINVKCNAQKIMFDVSYQTFWDTDRGVVTQAASPWLDVKNDLRYMQIAKFMCEPKARNDENLMLRADQSHDPLDTTWAVIWSDVKKPAFTTTKTLEQSKAQYEATLAKARDTIGVATAYGEKIIDDTNKEQEFMVSVRKNFESKDKTFHTLFYSMPGWSEDLINGAWGAPLRAGWDGETRFLVYRYPGMVYDDEEYPEDVIECEGGACNKVGEATKTRSIGRAVTCERTLYLRPGGNKDGPRFVDYTWSCPN